MAAAHVPEHALVSLFVRNRPRRSIAEDTAEGKEATGAISLARPLKLACSTKASQFCGEYLDAVASLLRTVSGQGPEGGDSLKAIDAIEREERYRENQGKGDAVDYGDTAEPLPEPVPSATAEAAVRKESLSAPEHGGPYFPVDAARVLTWLVPELKAAAHEVRQALSGHSTEDWVQGNQDGKLCSALQLLAAAAETSETARLWLAKSAEDGGADISTLLLTRGLFSSSVGHGSAGAASGAGSSSPE